MEVCLSGVLVFFFSSRRRHTRFKCDWSSDVCSSDLRHLQPGLEGVRPDGARLRRIGKLEPQEQAIAGKNLGRSEEHTSELQSHLNLVCRLLLEKKKKTDR